MSDSELMREMFRLEKLLQEGGPTTAATPTSKPPEDDKLLGKRIQEAISGADVSSFARAFAWWSLSSGFPLRKPWAP